MKNNIITIIILTLIIAIGNVSESHSGNQQQPQLKLVKHDLMQNGYNYLIKGKIYNPYDKGCKNVIIRCYVWKNLIGKDKEKYGLTAKHGGLVTSRIDYLPPKAIIDFETNDNAPQYTDLTPGKINVEISAEWE